MLAHYVLNHFCNMLLQCNVSIVAIFIKVFFILIWILCALKVKLIQKSVFRLWKIAMLMSKRRNNLIIMQIFMSMLWVWCRQMLLVLNLAILHSWWAICRNRIRLFRNILLILNILLCRTIAKVMKIAALFVKILLKVMV